MSETLFAVVLDGEAREVTNLRAFKSTAPDGTVITNLAGSLAALTAAERAARGIHALIVPDPPEGQVEVARALGVAGGAPTLAVTFDHPALADLAAALIEEIDAHRDQLIDGGFTHGGHRYQSRPSDRENIAALGADAAEAIRDGAQAGDYLWHPEFPEGFGFITADNVTVPLDAFAMRDLRGRGTRYKAALTFHARALKDAALAAAAAEDLAAFDLVASAWREGWPA